MSVNIYSITWYFVLCYISWCFVLFNSITWYSGLLTFINHSNNVFNVIIVNIATLVTVITTIILSPHGGIRGGAGRTGSRTCGCLVLFTAVGALTAATEDVIEVCFLPSLTGSDIFKTVSVFLLPPFDKKTLLSLASSSRRWGVSDKGMFP